MYIDSRKCAAGETWLPQNCAQILTESPNLSVSVTPLTNGNGSWYHIGNARHAWDGWCNEESLCIRNCSGPSAGLLHIYASSKLGSKAETKFCLQEWYWRILTRLLSKTFLKYPPFFFNLFCFSFAEQFNNPHYMTFFCGGYQTLGLISILHDQVLPLSGIPILEVQRVVPSVRGELRRVRDHIMLFCVIYSSCHSRLLDHNGDSQK